MISKDYVICPYCKGKNGKNKSLGTTGLINYGGGESTIVCDRCKKEFYCTFEVQIKFTTNKY